MRTNFWMEIDRWTLERALHVCAPGHGIYTKYNDD